MVDLGAAPPAIDAHVHLLDPERFTYGWCPKDPRIADSAWGVEDIRDPMREHAVTGVIVVQALDEDGETDWLLDHADEEPLIVAVVGWVDLHATPDRIAARLDVIGRRGLRGLRHRVVLEDDDRWLLSDEVDRGLQAVAGAGLPFELLIGSTQLDQVPILSERHPDLDFVLDHLGVPPMTSSTLGRWTHDITEAAANPRISCKVSALMRQGAPSADLGLVRAHTEAALDAFGPGRSMFGTDWPISTDGGAYGPAVTIARSVLGALTPADADAVFRTTAMRVYGITDRPGDGAPASGQSALGS